MTIHDFLALFHPVKDTKKGWDVLCPAHADTHPSLGVMEGDGGRIVLKCWAGCEVDDICTALGLTLKDLFPDKVIGEIKPRRLPPVKVSPRQRAWTFELHALDLRRYAEKILEAAKGCEDCDTWSHDDLEVAMKVVGRAYQALDRAAWCEAYADHVREEDYESQRSVPGQ